MAAEDSELHLRVREARRARKMTQSELARLADCSQSAVSMYEAGRPDALAADTVARLTEVLGLSADEPAAPSAAPAGGLVRVFCPVDQCPSNVPYVVRDRLCYRPLPLWAPAAQAAHCSWCGEVLERACPNRDCGQPVHDGAFCRACGRAYVTAAALPEEPPGAYAASRRALLAELRGLIRPETGAAAGRRTGAQIPGGE